MTRSGYLLLLLLLLLPAADALARSEALDRWFERELVPSVVEHLERHPRFRGETLLFVVFNNDRPAPVTNALALSLRDRLLDAAVDAGVNVAWQQQPHGASSCTRDKPDYYIGIELGHDLRGRHRVAMRALDIVEGTWVTGFTQSWEGTLTSRERAAYRNTLSDPAFRGTRDVPYTRDQADLVAKHLSHALSCEIFSGLDTDYVVSLEAMAAESGTPGDELLSGAVELAARNLDQSNALELTANAAAANARVEGKAHRIDGPLHQYWLSITPLDDDVGSLSTSVYITSGTGLPRSLPAASTVAARTAAPTDPPAQITGVMMPGNPRNELILPLSIYRAGSSDECGPGSYDCALLHARATDDVIVYTLVHAGSMGLSRLADAGCERGPSARVVTKGHSALVPVVRASGRSRDAFNSGRWLTDPGSTVYYAIAVDNARDARRIAALVDQLPVSCGGRGGMGLAGLELQQWLEELSRLMLELGPRAAWRAIEAGTNAGGRT